MMKRVTRGWRGSYLGPWTLLRRWRWARGLARLYEAFNRKTGATAIVLRPDRPAEGAPPARQWQARVFSTKEALAVELVPHPRSAAQVEEVTTAFYRLTSALANLAMEPESAEQPSLTGEVAALRAWRARYGVRPMLAAALVVTAVLALVMPPRAHQACPAAPQQDAPVQLGPVGAVMPVAMAPRVPLWAALGLDMPKVPFKGQVRPDASGKCELPYEVAINGGCWVQIGNLPPPCRTSAYEHGGACYLPSWPAPKGDTSAGQ